MKKIISAALLLCSVGVLALDDVSSIAAGGSHTCALTTVGAVKCWGKNNYGQLGDNSTTDRQIPVDVSGLGSGVMAITAGAEHSCALTTTGGVKCWGYNVNGQLGNNSATDSLIPVDVSGLGSGVISITAGFYHNCALTTAGGVKCWGSNGAGELGDNSTDPKLIPIDLSGLGGGVQAITAGYSHSCALTTAGGVKCWGYNEYGQLGDNSTSTRLTPVNVNGLGSGVTAIVAGRLQTCAITTTGGVKCWGNNNFGQLGDNSTTTRLTAVDVSGLSSDVMAITLGDSYTCALTTAGGLKCWGYNNEGELGDNSTTTRLTPVGVSGLGSGVMAITAGDYHSCALTTAGSLKCWGYNWNGQLGDNSTTDRLTAVDVYVDGDVDGDGVLNSIDNCPLQGNSDQYNADGDGQGNVCDETPYQPIIISSIAAGYDHTCVLTTAGGVECWGSNNDGQLGDNSTKGRKQTPVGVSGLDSGVTAIVAGDNHSCALTAAGGVKCWGYNDYGQLGDNSTTTRWVPVNVSGLGSGVMAITAGANHTCALTTAGGVKCWGDNYNGQLGNNSTTQRLTPVNVSGLGSGVTAIMTAYSHTCALTTTGGVKCWGYNDYGQLGDNSTTQRLTPVNVSGLGSGVMAVTPGASHTCALTTAGGVKCWGNNYNGQVGDNSTTQRLTPVNVSGLGSGVMAITAGAAHNCALTTVGGVKCWGVNYNGQLGDNSTTDRLTPVNVNGLGSGVMAITADHGYTCALTTAGGVKCWGGNSTIMTWTPVYVSGLIGDSDDDGVVDTVDNCLVNSNQDQLNTDEAGDGGNACDTDDDNDQMPDTWELTYGLDPLVNDASGDADNDGLTNLQEYDNGSNPIVARTKNDYNNDGIAGWIWQGVSNGNETQSQNWQLTFPLYSQNWAVPNRSFHPTFPDQANWDIVTSGDFNKDGDADIVWRHKTTDAWKIWQMQDGLRVAQTNWTDAFDPSHEWTVVDAGDTDKDGDDDIILTNTASSEVLIWEMQNYVVAATHNVGTKAGYTLNRIGDFNKDGDVDLLFRQNGGDALITWELQNNAFVAERTLNSTGAGYSPVCAGDFDSDGDDDIMFVNSTTQQEKWFVMENYTRTQQVGGINDGFAFLGCGDYDGDGDADSLWQRSADDKIRVVLQQDYGIGKQTVYTNAFGGANGFVYRGNSN